MTIEFLHFYFGSSVVTPHRNSSLVTLDHNIECFVTSGNTAPAPRQDLLSVLIEGPARTPYEDGLFLFDVQLPNDYPSSPPVFHYVSHCSERLNPNLYEDGKVCVSLLGTWSGRVSS